MAPPPLWTTHPATLLVPALLAWAATRRRAEQPAQPWHPVIDPALAIIAGLLWALACFYWASGFPLPDGAALTADLSDYCAALQIAREPGAPFYPEHRFPAIGAVLGPVAAHLGIMRTLQVAAVASAAVVGAALFVWGRAATDRRAGAVAATILGLAAQPLVTLGRQLTFYPEATAVVACGAAAVALALRHGSPGTLLLGGVGAGLVLATDARLLPLGLALAGAAVVAAIPGPLRRAPSRIALAAVPVVASWWAPGAIHRHMGLQPVGGATHAGASWGYVSLMHGLYRDHDPALTQHVVRPGTSGDLAWGFTTPDQVAPAVDMLLQLGRTPLDPLLLQEQVMARSQALWLFFAVVVGMGLVGAMTSWRTPRRLATAFGLPILFLLHLFAALQVLPRPRTAAAGSLAVPILLAAGLWAVGPRKAPPWAGMLVVLLLALAGAGSIPSWLHPQAGWRPPGRHDHVHPDAWAEQLRTLAREDRSCGQGLAQDEARGLSLPWPGPRPPPPRPPGPTPR
ncbi:hypothetical protein L6R53_18180 [Myxococcota bacterium]|nr:hypothetical protein [Myxococcota bacterium]